MPTYDGIYANFSLLHVPRADGIRHIHICHKALHTGGVLHLGMKTGFGARRDPLGRFYTYYTVEELRTILSDAGFTLRSIIEGSESGLAGPVEPFVLIRAYA